MHIRGARRSDIIGIAKIYDNGYDEVVVNPSFGDTLRLKRPGSARIRKWGRDLYLNMQKGHVLFFVAEENGKAVGFCFVRKKDIPDSEMSHVGVLGIRILPDFRGKGLGTRMVRRALAASRGRFDVIEVSIMSINRASKALFRKFGFRRWGVAPGYVKRGTRRIDMEYFSRRL